MVSSRPITLSLLFAATSVAASSSSTTRHLRASPQADQSQSPDSIISSSSQDIPSITETRTLQEDGVIVSEKCMITLAASANENGKIRKENYFVFTDGMANGYYSYNNMNSYTDLPMENKFGFVTLSCACHNQGGAGNCCQGERAKLDVSGLDAEEPQSMPDDLKAYVMDICSVTMSSIGDKVMPPTGELPTSAEPTGSPTVDPLAPSGSPTEDPLGVASTASPTDAPTASPTIDKDIPGIILPPGTGPPGDGDTNPDNGITGGAWAGIAVASAAAVTLFIYLLSDKQTPEDAEDDDLDGDMTVTMKELPPRKDLLLITNGEIGEGAPTRIESPDATNSMTAYSESSSIPSMSTRKSSKQGQNEYYANNSLLPGRPDEESMLSSSDGPSFFDTDSEAGVEISRCNISGESLLNTSGSSSGGDNLDQAIESGNWEAVAASAAAIVKQNESSNSISSAVEV